MVLIYFNYIFLQHHCLMMAILTIEERLIYTKNPNTVNSPLSFVQIPNAECSADHEASAVVKSKSN